VKSAPLDVFVLGKTIPLKLRDSIVKAVPDARIVCVDTVSPEDIQAPFWMFMYEEEWLSKGYIDVLALIIDPNLRAPDDTLYNGFTLFMLDFNDTSKIKYQTRIIRKGVPFDPETLHPTINDGFERILDGWIYTHGHF
jgi:hypothetical protein